jgi:hypothetical protein
VNSGASRRSIQNPATPAPPWSTHDEGSPRHLGKGAHFYQIEPHFVANAAKNRSPIIFVAGFRLTAGIPNADS